MCAEISVILKLANSAASDPAASPRATTGARSSALPVTPSECASAQQASSTDSFEAFGSARTRDAAATPRLVPGRATVEQGQLGGERQPSLRTGNRRGGLDDGPRL